MQKPLAFTQGDLIKRLIFFFTRQLFTDERRNPEVLTLDEAQMNEGLCAGLALLQGSYALLDKEDALSRLFLEAIYCAQSMKAPWTSAELLADALLEDGSLASSIQEQRAAKLQGLLETVLFLHSNDHNVMATASAYQPSTQYFALNEKLAIIFNSQVHIAEVRTFALTVSEWLALLRSYLTPGQAITFHFYKHAIALACKAGPGGEPRYCFMDSSTCLIKQTHERTTPTDPLSATFGLPYHDWDGFSAAFFNSLSSIYPADTPEITADSYLTATVRTLSKGAAPAKEQTALLQAHAHLKAPPIRLSKLLASPHVVATTDGEALHLFAQAVFTREQAPYLQPLLEDCLAKIEKRESSSDPLFHLLFLRLFLAYDRPRAKAWLLTLHNLPMSETALVGISIAITDHITHSIRTAEEIEWLRRFCALPDIAENLQITINIAKNRHKIFCTAPLSVIDALIDLELLKKADPLLALSLIASHLKGQVPLDSLIYYLKQLALADPEMFLSCMVSPPHVDANLLEAILKIPDCHALLTAPKNALMFVMSFNEPQTMIPTFLANLHRPLSNTEKSLLDEKMQGTTFTPARETGRTASSQAFVPPALQSTPAHSKSSSHPQRLPRV